MTELEQNEIVKVMQTALQELSFSDDEPQLRSYSGRGMYGKECVGVTLDISQFAEFCARAALFARDIDSEDMALEEDLCYVLSTTNWDSMGRSTIYYWPRLEWKNEYV